MKDPTEKKVIRIIKKYNFESALNRSIDHEKILPKII